MRIGIDLNGVLRDTLGKIEQVYELCLDYYDGIITKDRSTT